MIGNSEAQVANQILEKWAEQHKDDPQYNFERSTIHFDAGFRDPDHLGEVVNDWLEQDMQNAEGNNPQLAKKIQAKIEEIRKELP